VRASGWCQLLSFPGKADPMWALLTSCPGSCIGGVKKGEGPCTFRDARQSGVLEADRSDWVRWNRSAPHRSEGKN